jgi:N-acyl homoserine lactone hydrolase
MATAAEPRPAELPLPGARDRASVRLQPLLTGRLTGPEGLFVRHNGRLAWRRAFGLGAPSSDSLELPVPAFLVEHPGAGAVLIDTGFHPSVAVDPKKNLGRLSLSVFKDVSMEPGQSAVAQLRMRGIEPAQVRVVIMTHLHMDHASAISDFPDATFILSKAEWAAATTQGARNGYLRRQFDHAFDYRLLDFEGPGAESFVTFGRSFDLFGDGSVRCVYTPGHSPGHLSVVLRLRRREALVAADAVYLRSNLDEVRLSHRTPDDHLAERSLREIGHYARETPDALIIPGHDWDAFKELDAVYE